jgi:hypothetical protein
LLIVPGLFRSIPSCHHHVLSPATMQHSFSNNIHLSNPMLALL